MTEALKTGIAQRTYLFLVKPKATEREFHAALPQIICLDKKPGNRKGNSCMSYSLNIAPDTKQFCCLSVRSIRESELLIGESNKLLKTLNSCPVECYSKV